MRRPRSVSGAYVLAVAFAVVVATAPVASLSTPVLEPTADAGTDVFIDAVEPVQVGADARPHVEAEPLLVAQASPPPAQDHPTSRDGPPPMPLWSMLTRHRDLGGLKDAPRPAIASRDLSDLPASQPCEPHPPILIVGDEGPTGFVLGDDPMTGEPMYRPGSGVVAGNGTEDDPYIIEGWCIRIDVGNLFTGPLARFLGLDGIRLQDTTAHVEVRANTVGGFGYGVGVDDVAPGTVTVHSNHLVRNAWAASVESSAGIEIRNNTAVFNLNGVQVVDSESTEVSDNDIRRNADVGLYLGGGDRTVVRDNRIVDNGLFGAYLYRTDGASIVGNTLARHGFDGIRVVLSDGNEFEANDIADNEFFGLFLQLSDDNEIVSNTISENGAAGVVVAESRGTALRNNSVLDNPHGGVALGGVTNAVIAGNTFEGPGLIVFGSSPSHVRHEVEANTVNGGPLVYVTQVSDVVVDEPAGQVIVADARNVTVRNQSIHGTNMAILVAFGDNASIHDNELTDNWVGVFLLYSNGTAVENNRMDAGDVGVDVVLSDNATVRDNEVLDNTVGIIVRSGPDAGIHGNNFEGNTYGVGNLGNEPVDAELNWWGCPDGPDDHACDRVEGDVDYTPWLTAPNPDAGLG